jgi:hypothetical protein
MGSKSIAHRHLLPVAEVEAHLGEERLTGRLLLVDLVAGLLEEEEGGNPVHLPIGVATTTETETRVLVTLVLAKPSDLVSGKTVNTSLVVAICVSKKSFTVKQTIHPSNTLVSTLRNTMIFQSKPPVPAFPNQSLHLLILLSTLFFSTTYRMLATTHPPLFKSTLSPS